MDRLDRAGASPHWCRTPPHSFSRMGVPLALQSLGSIRISLRHRSGPHRLSRPHWASDHIPSILHRQEVYVLSIHHTLSKHLNVLAGNPTLDLRDRFICRIAHRHHTTIISPAARLTCTYYREHAVRPWSASILAILYSRLDSMAGLLSPHLTGPTPASIDT